MTTSWALLAVIVSIRALAADPPPPQSPLNLDQKLERQRRRDEQRMLESLKERFPEQYAQTMAVRQRGQRIASIAADFRAGRLNEDSARDELEPLIKEEIKLEVASLDARIAALQKQLDFLTSAKDDPDLLVKRRMDLLLGKSTGPGTGAPLEIPSPADLPRPSLHR